MENTFNKTLNTPSWLEQNQIHLTSYLTHLKRKLSKKLGLEETNTPFVSEKEEGALKTCTSALEQIQRIFSLSDFERDLLLLVASSELDSSFTTLFAQANPQHPYPTFGLALSTLEEAHWDALTPTAPLRYWLLIQLKGSNLTQSPLQIDERILHYLAGVDYLDERLNHYLTLQETLEIMPTSHEQVSHSIARVWTKTQLKTPLPIIHLTLPVNYLANDIAAHACSGLGLKLYLVDIKYLPTDLQELDALAQLINRESKLSSIALLIHNKYDLNESQTQIRQYFINQLQTLCIVATLTNHPLSVDSKHSIIRIEVPLLSKEEQNFLWQHYLSGFVDERGVFERINNHYNLSPQSIQQIAQSALNTPNLPLDKALWQVCKQHTQKHLSSFTQAIVPKVTWDDLILSAEQSRQLKHIIVQARHHSTVHYTWGLSSKNSRGLGITALFSGPSGTGKSTAAEVVASDLGLELYRIDLSQVISKYIGETEKNLSKAFSAAGQSRAILLFDEADALFGKRSEVRDSHDRYANIETSYLLQQMENYSGISILTSNLPSAIDSAFARRFSITIDFSYPSQEERECIWQSVFPKSTPTEVLDFSKFAELQLTGGNIRNIALHAAFLAAEKGKSITAQHVYEGVKIEYDKLGRSYPQDGLANT